MSDVLLFQTNDDGDMNITGGIVELSGGLQTCVYLSLFGGNEDDSGGSDLSKSWWANLNENNPARQYRSETQYLLQALPAIPANLRRIEDAARRDLAWLLSDKVATSVTVEATMPGVNQVRLQVGIGADQTVEFLANWNARS